MTIPEDNDVSHTFVGYFPTENEDGKGIAVIDERQTYQGYYPHMTGGFPDGYKKLDYIFMPFDVTDFR